MHESLTRNLYLVKEHVGMFKAASNYDIIDPDTGEVILWCREPHLGFITKMARFTDYKTMTPFDVHVTTPEGDPVLRVRRGVSLFLSKVQVLDDENEPVGGFQQRLFSIGGAFTVSNADGRPLCHLKGKWTGWEFKFEHEGVELAKVSKKWAGFNKEMFTSADSYVLQISDDVPEDNPLRLLILGAVLCIDMVLKER